MFLKPYEQNAWTVKENIAMKFQTEYDAGRPLDDIYKINT